MVNALWKTCFDNTQSQRPVYLIESNYNNDGIGVQLCCYDVQREKIYKSKTVDHGQAKSIGWGTQGVQTLIALARRDVKSEELGKKCK